MTDWILTSSVLILAVIALRFLFKGKISLRLQYALWGMVLLRLLVPFSFGSSSVSAANITTVIQDQPAVRTVKEIGQINIPTQSYTSAYQQVVEDYEAQGKNVEDLQGSELEALEYQAYDLMKGVELSEILTKAACIIWIAGIMAVGILFLYTNLRFRRKLLRSRFETDQISGGLPLYVTKEIDTPCLFGIRHPGIYVTYEVLNDPTLLRHALAHESTHYRHCDHIWSILRCICLAIHWYNPLVWWAAFLSQRDGELACDEATIAKLGERERAEYGRTLISMTCRKRTNMLMTATTMTTGKSGIKERILLIAKKPKMALYTLVIVLVIAAVAVGCTFTGANNAENDQVTETVFDGELVEFFQTYDLASVEDRMTPEEVEFIGATDEFALVYYSGMGSSLVLYRYEYVDGEIRVMDSIAGDCTISGGLSINHIDLGDKHIYFGTVSDYHLIPEEDSILPLEWKTLVLTDVYGGYSAIIMEGKTGYLCVLGAPLADFSILDQQDEVQLDLAAYLAQGYYIEEVRFADSNETATSPAETEPQEATIGLPEVGKLYEEAAEDKVCIAVRPTGISVAGDDFKYIIPEDQDALIAAYEKAYSAVNEDLYWDNNNSCSGWWVVYQGEWWQAMESGDLVGDGIMPSDEAGALYALCEAAISRSGLAEPVRTDEIAGIRSATLEWNGTHTVTDTYALKKIESWLCNSVEIRSAGCFFTGLLTLELENGETKFIAMATDSCATWMSEGVTYSFGIYDEDGLLGNEEFYSLFASEVIHDASEQGVDALSEYLLYLNWSRYANRYGADETFALMNKVKDLVIEKGWFLTACNLTKGLDGAYADYYAAILAELFEENKSELAKACLNSASDRQEETVLQLLSYHWGIPTEEVRAALESEITE